MFGRVSSNDEDVSRFLRGGSGGGMSSGGGGLTVTSFVSPLILLLMLGPTNVDDPETNKTLSIYIAN